MHRNKGFLSALGGLGQTTKAQQAGSPVMQSIQSLLMEPVLVKDTVLFVQSIAARCAFTVPASTKNKRLSVICGAHSKQDDGCVGGDSCVGWHIVER